MKIGLICSGSLILSGGIVAITIGYFTKRRRQSSKSGNLKNGEDSVLDANGVPHALADVFSPTECSDSSKTQSECCQNDRASSCACRSETNLDDQSKAKPRPNLGLPKKEYLALKKAGLLPAMPVTTTKRAADSRRMIIMFATQSGNAESFAKDLFEDASEKGFDVSVHDLASFNLSAALASTDQRPTLVFLCSTWTGGQPPVAAQPFFAWIRSLAPAGIFAGVPFCVYALGNSLYTEHFCGAGRELDAQLEALGGVRVCDRFEDDEADLKEGFGKWKDLLWMAQALYQTVSTPMGSQF
jgi:flavodoxin